MSTAPRAPARPAVRLGRGRRPQARKLRDARDALYREHILEIAERVFAEQGFAATRMQDIAAAAGISLATLYQSYPGKEDLYRGVLITRDRAMLEAVTSRWSGAIAAPESVEQVLVLMETHLHFLLDHPEYLRLLLRTGYAWYDRAAQPTDAEQQMWERGLRSIEAVLAWGVQRKVFNPGNATDQARLLIASQQARFANWATDGMRQARAEVVAQIQADFVRLLCRPAVAAELLAPDGAGLSARTLARLRELAASAKP